MDESVRDAPGGALSLDALTLLLVTGLTLHLDSFARTPFTTPVLNAVAVGLVGLYLAIDVLGRPLLAHGTPSFRLFYGAKAVVLAAVVGLLVVWPTCSAIGLRHASHPWMYVHDTSINVEAASAFLLQGKDPYAATYFNTPLARFGWHTGPAYGYGPNPALWMTDTFPAQELITVPVLLVARATIGWFDERFIYLAAFGVAVLLLALLAPTPTKRLALLAGVTLNPLWNLTFIYGQNDILVLAEVLAVLYFSLRERWRLALLALALGCATKQTVLILVPFYVWWLALRLESSWPARLERLALLAPWLLVPFILMVGPFAAWNWTAFYDGNFGYVAGTVRHSYPIQGYDAYGAASLVLWSGLVDGPRAYFPFWLMQTAAALPLGALLLRRIRASTPVATMLGAYAVVLFAIFYFSRFFHSSYAAFTIDLLLVAYLMRRPARASADDSYLSLDVLLPLLLVPQIIEPSTSRTNGLYAALAFGLLLAYVTVAALAPWRRLRRRGPRHLATVARVLVLAGLAEVTIYARALSNITNRLRWNVLAGFIHDTALQIQISAVQFLNGHNPYTATFDQTPLPYIYLPAGKAVGSLRRDLPLWHNPHLPLGILLGAQAQSLFNWLGLQFDERYLYLTVLLLAAALAALLAQGPARQLALLCTVVCSPLFAVALIGGQDDVLVLLFLLVTVLLLQRGHLMMACLAAGVAVAFKLTAWPLVPLLVAYLAALDRQDAFVWRRHVLLWAARVCALLLPLLASTAPFIVWNARALWTDTIAYPLGLSRIALPLDTFWGQGYQTLGFGRIALGAGWARVNGDGYIGPWLALGLGLAVLVALLYRLWRAPSLPLLLAGYVTLLFVLEYFSRFMADTTLGYLVALAPLSFLLPQPRPTARVAALPVPAPVTDHAAVAV